MAHPDDTADPSQPSVVGKALTGDKIAVDGGRAYENIVVFVGAAAASGIVGNVAYDLLKAGLVRALRRRQLPDTLELSDRELLAQLAVRDRCAELELPVPKTDQLREINWDIQTMAHTCRLRYQDIEARVRIPIGAVDGRQLEVTLYTFN